MIVTKAPLRITLGGGGTDLPSCYSKYGGFILSAAINKYVYIVLNRPAVDKFIRLKYSEAETVKSLTEIRHPLFRESLKLLNIEPGVELASMADITAGSGLGSSGTFLAALLLALHTSKKEKIDTGTLAEEACRVEMDIVRAPVGKQDQYLAVYGGITCLDIAKDGTVKVEPLNISAHYLSELRNNILLFYTGVVRRSYTILQQQKEESECGNKAVLENLLKTKEIGQQIKAALEQGNLDRFGELLDVHWQNKKKRSSKIANQKIEKWYETAKQCGVLGGKIMGAGGGGVFMLYCPDKTRKMVRAAMSREGLVEMSFDFEPEGAKVVTDF